MHEHCEAMRTKDINYNTFCYSNNFETDSLSTEKSLYKLKSVYSYMNSTIQNKTIRFVTALIDHLLIIWFQTGIAIYVRYRERKSTDGSNPTMYRSFISSVGAYPKNISV